ncbi:hypothetical protein AB0I81_29100 [Nonomuraea sp. NPDC050404]
MDHHERNRRFEADRYVRDGVMSADGQALLLVGPKPGEKSTPPAATSC